MKCYQSVWQLAFLCVSCVLITVRESDSTFVPGRCLCPITEPGVKGGLKDLSVLPSSPSCNQVTVIVTMIRDSAKVCLSPMGAMGKQLVRCWNRAQSLNRDTKVCLKRKRRGGRRQRTQRRRQQRRRSSSLTS